MVPRAGASWCLVTYLLTCLLTTRPWCLLQAEKYMCELDGESMMASIPDRPMKRYRVRAKPSNPNPNPNPNLDPQTGR